MQSNTPKDQNTVTEQQINREVENTEQHQTSQPPFNARERYKEPVRINADDQSQCKLFLYIAAVTISIIIFIIISAYALPEPTKALDAKQSLVGSNLQNCSGMVEYASYSTNYLSCYNKTSFLPGTSNSLGIYVKLFSNLNQFMLFYIDLNSYVKQQTIKYENFNQNITFTVYSALFIAQNNNIKVVNKLHAYNITINQNLQQIAKKKYFLGYQSKIASGQQYFIEITFANGSTITKSAHFSLSVQTVRENFTIYTIVIRVFFFIVSLIFFVKYTLNCMAIPRKKISIQQKGVQIIGALTLLYNDQFYFVTVLWPNPLFSFLSALFIWTYLFGLFVLWCLFIIRIIHQESDTETVQLKYPWRIALFTFFYITGLTFCAGYGIIQSGQYPMVSVNAINYNWFKVYLFFIILCLIIAFLYLFYLYIHVCQSKPLRPYRQSAFIYVSLFYAVVIIIVSLMGSFQVYNFSGGLIFFTFGFINSYSYFLMYLYSPSKKQSQKYSKNEFQARDSGRIEESKTVNIDLLQVDSEIQNEDTLRIDLESSKNQNRNKLKYGNEILEKEQKVKHKILEEQCHLAESQQKILYEGYQEHQRAQQKSQISIDQSQV